MNLYAFLCVSAIHADAMYVAEAIDALNPEAAIAVLTDFVWRNF